MESEKYIWKEIKFYAYFNEPTLWGESKQLLYTVLRCNFKVIFYLYLWYNKVKSLREVSSVHRV